jgi:riboflavin biosynthesis pyrimidine reductase
MRRLFPPGAPDRAEDAWSLAALAAEYAYPDRTGPWLRANMVGSLDGAAHHGGRSQPLSSAADMRIFGVLRALADVIVVGAGTVRQEGYGPVKPREAFAAARAAAGQPPAAAVAVVSASLDLDFSAPLFTGAQVPTLLLTGGGAPPARLEAARAAGVEVVRAGATARVDPALVPGALAARGMTRLLTEGGPTLLGQFASAGVLDELCLTVSPRVALGDAVRVMDGRAAAEPFPFTLEGLLEEDGFLFTRYRKYVPPGA